MCEWDKWLKTAQERFKDHKATLIQDSDRFTIIDWRNADGRVDYYINFIVDKKRGSLIVSGDLGDSIATWFNPVTVSKLKSYIYNDVGYYIGKFQCTSDDFYYEVDDVFDELVYHLGEEAIEDYIGSSCDFDDYDDFKETIKEEISSSIYGDEFIPSGKLYEIATDIYQDAWEFLSSCGKRIAGRVYLWAIGFNMACEQLRM